MERFPPEISGAGLQMKRIGEELFRIGFPVYFLTISNQIYKEKTKTGINIVRFITKNRGSVLYEILVGLKVLCYLTLRRRTISVLMITGLSRRAYALLIWAWTMRVPVIYRAAMQGGDDPNALLSERFGSLKVRLLGLATVCTATTPQLKKLYLDAFPLGKVSLISNGVDVNRFRPATDPKERDALRAELDIPKEAKVIVTTGVVCPRKRTHFIMRAIRILHGMIDNFVFLHMGSFTNNFAEFNSDYCLEVISIAQNLPSEKVRFVGHTSKINLFLRASDVFAFASVKEGCPNAVLEAMASGLPVVMTRLESVDNFLVRDEVEGIVIDNINDIYGFAQATRNLLLDDIKREEYGKSSSKRVKEYFSIERTVAEYHELYMRILRP
jgi:glycosyltransferase involved in cell wall biosynthesis